MIDQSTVIVACCGSVKLYGAQACPEARYTDDSKEGRFPAPRKLGPKINVWPTSVVNRFCELPESDAKQQSNE